MPLAFHTQREMKQALAAKDAEAAALKKKLSVRKSFLDVLTKFNDQHGRAPQEHELLGLFSHLLPSSKRAAVTKPAPVTAAATPRAAAAPTTAPVVVPAPPPAHAQGSTMMDRQLAASRAAFASQGQAEAAKRQPAAGTTLAKSAFDLLTPQAKLEFFRAGNKLIPG